ncbi:hypothetical protein [Gloeothece verrucosa]|uniref:Uncharacterized protein n=1 Tax=Gloeothece verrucosa (strain PCC 7822) TaxID=497965 RepID=E0UNP5_GLOV7|nr:hypothetical protein [Gloeothece verrucosa]ADN18575.1 hypothetical protein Cyan7822_6937 [Gloeothece verrucosa PCC 7822]
MASPIVATYSLGFASFLELAPSLRTQGAKFYTEAEGTNRILKFTKLPLLAQNLLSLAEPELTDDDTMIMPIEEFNKLKEEALASFNLETTETSSSPLSTIEEQVNLTTSELSKLTKAQLIKLAAKNNIELPKTVKTRKNQLVEFLASLIPAAR